MPYVALLHTHTLLISLYLLLFLIKLVMLFTASEQKLASFRRKTRILEMVLPTLFLITGIYLAYLSPQFLNQPWFVTKLILLVAAILSGIFAFKNRSRFLGFVTLLIFAYIVAMSISKSLDPFNRKPYANKVITSDISTDPASPSYNLVSHGSMVYGQYCVTCHGPNGDKGNSGAANLKISKLDSSAVHERIENGKKNMPAFGKYLSDQEKRAVTGYVMSLRR